MITSFIMRDIYGREGVMFDQTNLPAKLEPGALMPASPAELVPALIADAGEAATWRYIDFFTANIRNPTRGPPTLHPS